jgi:FlaA1/EpsC-like NDP-sugar epimerase
MDNPNIMIIGAAGSLGLSLCHLLSQDNESKIFAVDFNENTLAYLSRLYDISTYIADFQNTHQIARIIENNQIDTVVNCAALKHVKWCENNIRHAIDVNILANLNLMEYLHLKNKNFIYISSDKAIKPTNFYALTKQLTDYIVKHYNFTIVRGVNFFNSKGSVIDIWETQRKYKKPFTVTSDNCKRYFILKEEMAQIVMKAIKDDTKKEFYPERVYGIYIQDLFESYLAFRHIEKKGCIIKSFSIPPHEKLCENLDFQPEIIELDTHDKIVEFIRLGIDCL